jgi:uncharacterized protein (TIGR02118 family)
MTAHLLIMYPMPKNAAEFDRAYREEHLPYAGPRLAGATGVTTQHVVGPSFKRPPYHLISDVSFPSVEALKACAASEGGKEALAHAASISSGGSPLIVALEDDA